MVLRGIRWALSIVISIIGTLLFFLGLSMFLIFLIDNIIYGHDPYENWAPNIYLPMVLSLICFTTFFVMNMDRFKFLSLLRAKVGPKKRSVGVEELDLD